MYVITADPRDRKEMLCSPIQNANAGVTLSEVFLKRGYTTCITKDCKIVCHDIYTLHSKFFDKKMGFLRPKEQKEVQAAIIHVFDLL